MAAGKSTVLLALVVVVVVSSSSSLDRSCMPMQWESLIMAQVGQLNQGKGTVYDVSGKMSLDYKLGKQAIVEDVYSGGQFIASYKIVTSAKAMYLIDLAKKTCTLLPGVAVDQICSDNPGITLIGSWTLGTQMTDTYKMASTTFGDGYITFFRNPFTVASESIAQSISGVSQLTVAQFGNVTEGIKDMSVFDIPSYCQSSKMEKGDLSHLPSLLTFLP